MKKLSRRKFIALSGVSAAGAVLASTGCAPVLPPSAVADYPTSEAQPAAGNTQPAEGNTQPAAEKPQPAAEKALSETNQQPTATSSIRTEKSRYRPEIVRFFPDQKSQVVRARSTEVWKDEALDPAVVRSMLDRSITRLTGIEDVTGAWQALFKPEERIVLKVNAFRNSLIWTHVPLVQAITDSLQEAGIPGEQITIFDYYSNELQTAGFTLNSDGPGVRCYGTDTNYSTRFPVGNTSVQLSDILLAADALINIPVLKSHMIAGMTFALKNHYGSVDNPGALHNMQNCLGALNALPEIKEITRLIVGDVLEANTSYKSSFPYWEADARGDSILMSYDPLAMDRVGLDILVEMAEEKGNSTTGILGMAERWLDNCQTAGVGTCRLEQIELLEA